MATALILFSSVHFALKAERALKKRKLEAEMVPVPRSLSADCGICAQVDVEDLDRVIGILKKAKINHDDVYRVENKRFVRYEPD